MENWTIFGETLKPGEMRRTTLRIPMGGLPNHGALRPADHPEERHRTGVRPAPTLISLIRSTPKR